MKRRSTGDPAKVRDSARKQRADDSSLQRILRGLLFAFVLFAAWSIALNLQASPERLTVAEGDPSPRDIKSPRQLTYISEIKSNEARQAAASQVPDVYSGPSSDVARQQLQTLRHLTDYVTALRHDEFTTTEARLELIRQIPAVSLSEPVILTALEQDEEDWQAVVAEAQRVLDLTMRDEIRMGQVSDAARQVRRLVSYSLSEPQRELVVGLASPLVVANSFYDAEQTDAQRTAAREAVEPVPWSILEGESIVREGEIVSALALEKLTVLGLLEARGSWENRAGVLLLSLSLVAVLALYVGRGLPILLGRPRRMLLLLLLMITVGFATRIAIPGHTLIPYFFPAATAAMLTVILLDQHLALVVSAIVAILVGYNAGSSLEMVVYTFVGSLVGAISLWRIDGLGRFARAALYVALANVAVILAFRLRSQSYDVVGLVQLLGAGLTNAVLSSSLTFVAFAFIGRVFGITTSLQLLDLARPTHPLFRQLLIKTPGTYHHTIVISNMAERAAEVIGADALLARVGSYYHDIGKTVRPYFFVENQNDGLNPHDNLDPRTSAEIIISHTTDGLMLARKYGLPDRVQEFIPEHHGTTLVTYFYRMASQANNGEPVDEEAFRYPGPRPQSRETAIVMLADSIEAMVRANRPATQPETERVVRQVINDRLVSGQLDECDLTLRDLDRIRQAFIGVLQGVFHPRIQYPERVQRKVAVARGEDATNA